MRRPGNRKIFPFPRSEMNGETQQQPYYRMIGRSSCNISEPYELEKDAPYRN
jgi:hypothetical protein